MRPFFKHFGSKWGLSGRVPAPAHDVIVEPFAGGAGYSTRYGARKRVLLYDTDEDTCAIWDYLLGATQEQILKLPLVHPGDDIREMGLARPEILLIQRWLTPSGGRGNWWLPASVVSLMQKAPGSFWGNVIRSRIAEQLPLVAGWEIHCATHDAAPDIGATWSVDPVYQHNKAGHSYYKSEPIDYGALGDWCKSRRGQVMVHEQSGADWLPFVTLNESAPTGSFHGVGRKSAHEVWWTNNTSMFQLMPQER